MDFTATRNNLLAALTAIKGATESKTTIPVLANVLIEAGPEGVTLTATDLEMTLRTGLAEAKVKKPGAGTVPARKLHDLLRLFPEGDVRIRQAENHWHEVSAIGKKYKLVGIARDNFPAPPAVPGSVCRLPYSVLALLIERTAFAVSKEESRYTLNGTLLRLQPEAVRMVATDGHRMAIADSATPTGQTTEENLLIPRRVLAVLARLDLSADTQMDIGANESFLSFAAGDWQMVARLLTGQFPNYEAVLPKAGNKTLTVDTAELKGALSRVAQMADVRTSAVKFSLDAETALQSSSPEYGEATEQIDAEYTGEPLAIGFNATYLLDFLAHTSGKVEAVFSDENSAGLFRIAGRSDYQYVVMPMRVWD